MKFVTGNGKEVKKPIGVIAGDGRGWRAEAGLWKIVDGERKGPLENDIL